jgi:hypothetical protein
MKKLILLGLMVLSIGIIKTSYCSKPGEMKTEAEILDVPPQERVKELKKELKNISVTASFVTYEIDALAKALDTEKIEKLSTTEFKKIVEKLFRIVIRLNNIEIPLNDLKQLIGIPSKLGPKKILRK